MALLVGTDDGLIRADEPRTVATDARRALRGEVVRCLDPGGRDGVVYAATLDGAYRSTDDGREWTPLDVPLGDENAWTVLATATGLFVGTDGPSLYRSTDGGDAWTELTGIHDLPSRDVWGSPVDPDRGRVRSLQADPADPDCLMFGVEAGGIHTSEDGGDTWRDHREASPDDVHEITPIGPGTFLIATGHLDWDLETETEHALGDGGVHLTTDGGDTWTRLEPDNAHSYVRGLCYHDERLYFGGSTTHPGEWAADGRTDSGLFESPDAGETLERVDYPGEPAELVESWTVADGTILAGTGAYSSRPPEGVRGRVIRRHGGGYETVARLSRHVTCIESV